MDGHEAPPGPLGAHTTALFANQLDRIIQLQLVQVDLQRTHLEVAREAHERAKAVERTEQHGCGERAILPVPRILTPQSFSIKQSPPPEVEQLHAATPRPAEDVIASQDVSTGRDDLGNGSSEQGSKQQALKRSKLSMTELSHEVAKIPDQFLTNPGVSGGGTQQKDGTDMAYHIFSTCVPSCKSAPADLFRDCTDIPKKAPAWVRWYLAFIGVLPVQSFAGWRRAAYRGWFYFILFCYVWTLLGSSFTLNARYRSGIGGFPQEAMILSCAASQMVVWGVFMRAVRRGAATLTLMHDMDRRGFDWHREVVSARRFAKTTCCWLVISIIDYLNRLSSSTSVCHQVIDRIDIRLASSTTRHRVCSAVDGAMLPALVVLYCVLLGLVWCLRFFCRLHKHELMWYASAVTFLLEQDNDTLEMMHALNQAEVLVTWRLRFASDTWVRAAVFFIAILGGVMVFLVTHLMSSSALPSDEIASDVTYLLLSIMICVLWGLPLAQVAEVFDVDVLRALNNPLVVKTAQRHFGQQLLAHLQTLDWGFRIGQTVIDMKMVVSLVTAVVVATVTALSQAVLQQLPTD